MADFLVNVMTTLKQILSDRRIWLYTAIAYIFTWLVWTPLLLNEQLGTDLPTISYQHFLGAFGPCVGALLTTVITEGLSGLRLFLRRALQLRIGWWLYAFAIASPLLFFFLAAGVAYAFEGSFVSLSQFGLTDKIDTSSFVLVWLFWIATYGFGEELGWRGFLLPRIARLTPTATAALFVAQYWALWHLPAFFYQSGIQAEGFAVVGWYIGLVFGSVVLAWLTRNARWGIVPAMIWHGTFNLVAASDQAEGLIAGLVSALVILTAIVLVRIYGRDLLTTRKPLTQPPS